MRVDYDDDDVLIGKMISSARKFLEKRLNKPLVATDYVLRVQTSCANDSVDLPQYVTGDVTISDLDNDSVLLTDDEYTLTGNLLQVGYKGFYKAQYSVTPVVDADIIEALKMLVAYRYNNRGDNEKQSGRRGSYHRAKPGVGRMKLGAGDFKKKVAFKQPTETQNEEGGTEKDFVTSITTWAAEKTWSQARAVEVGNVDLVNTKIIYIRYAQARAVIDKDWLVEMDGKRYTIFSKPIIQDSGLKVFEITCKAK